MIMQSTWMWNLEHGPNGERDVFVWDYKLPFSTCFLKPHLYYELFSINVQDSFQFQPPPKNQQWTAQLLARLQNQHGLPRCFGSTWASYYCGRPDGLTYQKKMTRKTTDSRHLMVPWNPLPLKNLIHPWPDENLYLKMPKRTWNFQNET